MRFSVANAMIPMLVCTHEPMLRMEAGTQRKYFILVNLYICFRSTFNKINVLSVGAPNC
jgi:hypothetical protein